MSYTIYDEKIWPRMLEKHPDLKALAIKAGVENNPEKAREIKAKFKDNIGRTKGILSETEVELAINLSATEMVEQSFLNMVVLKGSHAYRVGEYGDAWSSFGMVLEDFNWTFKDFIETCEKRNIDLNNISFAKAYEVFLEVIQLKLEYKIPYTKLFIRQLLQMSEYKEKDSLEIQDYFSKNDPIMLKDISCELLLTDGSN